MSPGNLDAATGYVCIPAGARVSIGAGIEGRVQALDIASGGQLDILEGGKVFVYGDHQTRPTHVRAGATLTLTAGSLGGPGRIEMAGTMNWRRTSHVSTLTTDPVRVTNPEAPSSLSPGRLVVEATGTLLIDKTLADDVRGGVNLFDRYVVEVDGLVQVGGTTYVAADHGTRIEIGESGVFDFLGDGNVFEGRFDPPQEPLAEFVNDGLVRKSGGTGVSAVNAIYTGNGEVDVLSGSFNAPYAQEIIASVDPDGSLGTGSCPEANVCALRTTAAEPQVALVQLPGAAEDPDGAEVSIAKTSAVETAADLQPPVELDVAGLAQGATTNLDFAFDRTIKALPRKGEFDVFQRRANVTLREAPELQWGRGALHPSRRHRVCGADANEQADRGRADGPSEVPRSVRTLGGTASRRWQRGGRPTAQRRVPRRLPGHPRAGAAARRHRRDGLRRRHRL